MSKLDKTKDYGTTFMGDRSFYGQGNKLFSMQTLEEVEWPKPDPNLVCKFCGVKRDGVELMREHLIANHSSQIAQAKKDESAKSESPKLETPEEKAEAEEKPKVICCDLCDKTYKVGNSEKRAKTLMEKHIRKEHAGKNFA